MNNIKVEPGEHISNDDWFEVPIDKTRDVQAFEDITIDLPNIKSEADSKWRNKSEKVSETKLPHIKNEETMNGGECSHSAVSQNGSRAKMDHDKMEKQFYETLLKKAQKHNSSQISSEKYNKLREDVKMAKRRNKKLNRDYWLLRHYDVLTVGEEERLVAPVVNEQILYYISFEHIFKVLHNTHEMTNHGGRDKMRKELQQRYKNITIHEVQTFLNLCEVCAKKRKIDKKDLVGKYTAFSESNSGCKVNLIDYQTKPDGKFKFIMVYEDCLTKFVILKSLTSKNVEEIARNVLDVFLIFGAPAFLRSDRGQEFCEGVIESLEAIWPQLKIVYGDPQNEQQDLSLEKEVEGMLVSWMSDNKCVNWSRGLGFVQFVRNRAFNSEIKQTPFEAMFGQGQGVDKLSDAQKTSENDKIDVPIVEIYKCKICRTESEFQEGDLCVVCTKKNNDIMKCTSNFSHPEVDIGMTVKINSSDADREKGHKEFVLATVLKRTVDGLYQLRTESGALKDLYRRSQFSISPENLILLEDVPDDDLPLCKMAKKQLIEPGKGLLRCICKNKCKNNRCSCVKNKLLCNSKCHSRVMCCNK